MTSTTTNSARRVLGDISVNTPVKNTGGLSGDISGIATPLKKGMDDLKQSTSMNAHGGGGDDTKRLFEYDAKRYAPSSSELENVDGREDGSAKRRKIGDSTSAVAVAVEQELRGRQFLSPQRPVVDSAPSSVSTSPSSSSFGNSTNELNDTQNTLLTLPDEFPQNISFTTQTSTQSSSSSLTPEELRAKAQSIRLRLSLASYKVRTNQIDVPISQLQIRSSAIASTRPPQFLRMASNTSIATTSTNPIDYSYSSFAASASASASQQQQQQQQRVRTALPSAPDSSFDDARRLNGNYEGDDDNREEMPSSPPMSSGNDENALQQEQEEEDEGNDEGPPRSPTKGVGEVREEGFATPILPRQRQGLLNPPLLGGRAGDEDGDGERDLTSSVVKGRAADGLLSLMRVRE